MPGLRQGVVIDVPNWKVPVIAKKKLLKQPEIAVDIKFTTEDVKEMPDKQFKVFEQQFEKRFTPEFNKMSNGWFGDMQKAMDTTEDALDKLSKDKKGDVKKLMEQVVDKTNANLVAKCKTWIEMARKLAQKAYDEAYEASIKEMKLKITKAKAKIGVKIAIMVLLTLTAAAVTIAASVVTMGAGAAIAPVVLAALVTAGKALLGSVSEVTKSYDVLANTLAAVEADAKAILKSAVALNAAKQKTAGTWDKVKAFKAYMSADVEALDKHVGQLDKFAAVARDKTLRQVKELQEIADQLAKAKAGSPEADKLYAESIKVQKSMDGAFKALAEISEVSKQALDAKEAAKKFSPEDVTKAMPKLVSSLTKLKTAVGVIKEVAGPIKTIVTGAQKIAAKK
ncbi:hypothetical protein [Roseateles asaccharophilus]|uniref:Methyl-accepting chemotaxis protein n=1 Tax=Roseateles asaccharophilus TaxID=582607 RepID=A0ABU2AB79_9BURK|nr:hypothetical protein [Roseateles asaccharophilus]MDR7333853.1 methyl-accepting chemotaxis protein [Roseateles asaccharophilus]